MKRPLILNRMEAGKNQPQPKYFFETGDEIRVIDGPFTNFNGIVEDVNPEKGKIKVLVSIFGPVDTGRTGFCSGNEIMNNGWNDITAFKEFRNRSKNGKKGNGSDQASG
jgi:hypothetical protein